jgi:hypothetical protein
MTVRRKPRRFIDIALAPVNGAITVNDINGFATPLNVAVTDAREAV